MASIVPIIDLDKYEFKTELNSLNGYGDDKCDYLEDYQTLEADIIDYGICEEEYGETSSNEPLILETPKDTQKKPSVNTSNIHSSYKTKRVSIKVVDCDKFPWYYSKYKNQILRRKYFAAIDHARNIVKCIKNSLSDEDIFINVDELSDDDDKTGDTHTEKNQTSDKLSNHKKPQRKLEDCKIHLQKSSTIVDLKKNTGLIGMKVQKVDNDMLSKKYAAKKKHCKENLKKQKSMQYSKWYEKTDKASNGLRTFCYKTQAKEQERNKTQSISVNGISENTDKFELGKNRSMKCSLKINSPKILMKITKIKPVSNEMLPDNFKSIESIHTTDTLYTTANNDCFSWNTHEKRSSNDCKKIVKYKPMPKCKKIALEKQNLDKNEDDLNKNTEIPMKFPETSEHLTTLKKNTFDVASTYSTKVNTELPIMKSFPFTNKFTGKVMKIVNNNFKYDTKLKKRNKNKIVKNKAEVKSSQNIISEPLQKKIYCENDNIGRNCIWKTTKSVSVRSDSLNNALNNVEVPAALSTVAPNIEIQTAHSCEGISKIKNMDSIKPLYLISSNKSKAGNNTKSTELTDGTTKSNTEKNDNMDNQSNATPVPCLSKSILNDSHQHNVTTPTFQVRNRKQAKENQTVNIEDYIKTNLNIQPITSLSQEPPEPQEYIVPDVIYPPKLPSEFNYEKMQSNEYNENQIAHLITQPVPSPLRDTASTSKQTKTVLNTSIESSSDTNIARNYPSYSETSVNHIPINSQIPVLTRPPLRTTKRPHILKRSTQTFLPQCGPRFQQPPQNASVLPQFNIRPPPFAEPSPSLRDIRPWQCYRYQHPNYRQPSPNVNVQRMAWNDSYQQARFHQNNYCQQPNYRTEKSQGVSNNVLPPGICNVIPNQDYNMPYNFCNPLYPPQNLPPHQFTPNFNNTRSSIIGKNTTGFIKKINIPTPVINSDIQISNAELLKKDNASIQSNAELKKISVDNAAPVLSKLEMMKELEKANTEILNTVNEETKIPSSTTLSPKSRQSQLVQVKSNLNKQLPETEKPGFQKAHLETFGNTLTKPISEKLQRDTGQTLIGTVEANLQKSPPKISNAHLSNIPSELKRPYPNKQKAEQTHHFRNNRPGPLSKKNKANANNNDIPTTPPRDSQRIFPNNGYSPPILPIPTYQNILSEVEEMNEANIAASTSIVELEKPFTNACKKTPIVKSILRNKLKKSNKEPEPPQDNTKKISLEEYKKRSLNKQKGKKKKVI